MSMASKDDFEIATGCTEQGQIASDELVSRSLARRLRAFVWHRAKVGFRCASWIVGPFCVILATFDLVFLAFSIGTGRGVYLPKEFLPIAGAYFVSVIWGIILGGLSALVEFVLRRGKVDTLSAFWLSLNRPMRFLFRRRGEPSVKAQKPFRGLRVPRILIVTLVVLLVVAEVAGFIVARLVDRRLANAIAAARADDPNWELNDLMAAREIVPDDENSAIVVAKVVSLLPESWPPSLRSEPGGHPPERRDAAKAYDAMSKTPPQIQLDKATVDTLREELNRVKDALVLARSVVDYPKGRHEVEFDRTMIDAKLQETKETRHVARLLAADAGLQSYDGDADGAIDSCRAMLCVARSVGDDPLMISQLLRIAIGGVTLDSTRRALAQGEPSDQSLAHLQELILDELSQPILLHGLRAERATSSELIRRVSIGEVSIRELSDDTPPGTERETPGTIAPWGRLWFDHQRAVLIERMNAAVAIARRPSTERPALWVSWDAELKRIRRSQIEVWAAMYPLLMLSATDAFSTATSKYETELAATAILLAAERHRRKTGNWPDSIDAIDPSILPVAPKDPFTGQPLHTVHRDGQLLIYSVGPNLRDESGAFNYKTWPKGGPDDFGTSGWDLKNRRQLALPAKNGTSTP